MLNRVDLPQPDGPITAKNSPGATSNETLSSAITRPFGRVEPHDDVFDDQDRAAAACGSRQSTRFARRDDGHRVGLVSLPARVIARVIDRRVAGLDAHIDDRDLAGIDARRSPFPSIAGEIAGPGDRAETDRALGAAHGGEIDVGIGHPLADPFVLDRPVARPRHPLLMHLVVIERAVVGHDDQQRNAVMHRGPQRGDAHQEIAVAADRDRQPAASRSASAAPTAMPGPAPTPPPPSEPR